MTRDMAEEDPLPVKSVMSSSSFSGISTIKCKRAPSPIPKIKKDVSDDDIAVLDSSAHAQLVVPVPEKELPLSPPIFRIRDQKLGPALRPRGSKRSTMTWPGCR